MKEGGGRNEVISYKQVLGNESPVQAWSLGALVTASMTLPLWLDCGLGASARAKFQILPLRKTTLPPEKWQPDALEMTPPLQNQTKVWESHPSWKHPAGLFPALQGFIFPVCGRIFFAGPKKELMCDILCKSRMS